MRLVATIAFALALSGCVSAGTQVTDQQAAQFRAGITTQADVIAKLGRPDAISHEMNGATVIVYTHVQSSPNAVDFVPLVGLLAGGASGQATSATFSFGADGRLIGYTATEATSDVRSGVFN